MESETKSASVGVGEEKTGTKQINNREIWVESGSIYLGEDNVFYIIANGEIDDKMAIETKEALLKHINMVEGKVSFLIDLNRAGKQSPGARKCWKELGEHEKTDKVALFGMNPVARVVASFAMGIIQKKDMRFFKTKEDALAWLKE